MKSLALPISNVQKMQTECHLVFIQSVCRYGGGVWGLLYLASVVLKWAFPGCTCHFVGFVVRRLNVSETVNSFKYSFPDMGYLIGTLVSLYNLIMIKLIFVMKCLQNIYKKMDHSINILLEKLQMKKKKKKFISNAFRCKRPLGLWGYNIYKINGISTVQMWY